MNFEKAIDDYVNLLMDERETMTTKRSDSKWVALRSEVNPNLFIITDWQPIFPRWMHSLPCDGSKKNGCNNDCLSKETIRKNLRDGEES